MIVPMKRVTMLLPQDEVPSALETLEQLGVVHIEPVVMDPVPEEETLRSQAARVKEALEILPTGPPEALPLHSCADAQRIAVRAVELHERKEALQDRLQSLQAELASVGAFEALDPQALSPLREAGLSVRLYRCNRRELKGIPADIPHWVVASQGRYLFVLAIDTQDTLLPLQEVPMPERGASQLRHLEASVQRELAAVEEELSRLGGHREALVELLGHLQRQMEHTMALRGAGRSGEISYVQGFCPARDVDRVRQAALEEQWGLMVEDPSPQDEVPTLLENPPLVRAMQKVLQLMGTLPGYWEYDVSIWFLVFLSLFFAMLIGDGGYGLLFLAGTFLLHRKLGKASDLPFPLLYLFSGATVVWGALSGTWFGVEALSTMPGLRDLVIPALYGYAQNQDFMIHMCFLIGLIHLGIAHLMRMARLFPSVACLSEGGWLIILVSLFFFAESLVLGKPLPSWSTAALAGGVAVSLLAALFPWSSPAAFLTRVLDLPLKVVRSFSDIISYIRLFAVGYATLVMAVTFNGMASEMGWSDLPRALGSAIILAAGHALNVLLASMAVLVHGLRLNMLEFCSHLEMTWSGRPFAPFGISARRATEQMPKGGPVRGLHPVERRSSI